MKTALRPVAIAGFLTSVGGPLLAEDMAHMSMMTCAEFAAMDHDAMMAAADALTMAAMADDAMADDAMADEAMADDAGAVIMASCDGMGDMTVIDAMAAMQ